MHREPVSPSSLLPCVPGRNAGPVRPSALDGWEEWSITTASNGNKTKISKLMKSEEKAVSKIEKKFHAKEKQAIGVRSVKPRKSRKPKAKRPLTEAEFYTGKRSVAVQEVLPFVPHYTCDLEAQPSANGGGIPQLVMSQPIKNNMNSVVKTAITGEGSGAILPDPYTYKRMFQVTTRTTSPITPIWPSSGTQTYGGTAGVFVADPVYSLLKPTLTAAASSVGITWSTGANVGCGVASADFLSRPAGAHLSLRYVGIGPVHNIHVFAFPIIPLKVKVGDLVAAPVGWPTYCEGSLTALHNYWGGRDFELAPGDSAELCAMPLDMRGWDFDEDHHQRQDYTADGRQNWGGWVYWAWGFTAGDYMTAKLTYTWDMMVNPNATSTTVYAYQTSRIPVDPMSAAKDRNMISKLADLGYSAYKFAADHAIPALRTAWNLVSPFLAADAPIVGIGTNTPPLNNYVESQNAIARTWIVHPSKPRGGCAEEECKEEAKVPDIEDMPVVLTPQAARRPSLSKLAMPRVKMQ